MITIINSVGIHHLTVITFFLVRTFKIDSLSNFPIYNRMLLTLVTMLYITSPELI